MRSAVTVAYWESVVLLAGFFGILFWKLVIGEVPLSGLLDGDVRDPTSAEGFSSRMSAGRAQSLTVTLFVALWYLVQVIHNPRVFPELPGSILGALGASHALYLGGKAQSIFFGRVRDLFK